MKIYPTKSYINPFPHSLVSITEARARTLALKNSKKSIQISLCNRTINFKSSPPGMAPAPASASPLRLDENQEARSSAFPTTLREKLVKINAPVRCSRGRKVTNTSLTTQRQHHHRSGSFCGNTRSGRLSGHAEQPIPSNSTINGDGSGKPSLISVDPIASNGDPTSRFFVNNGEGSHQDIRTRRDEQHRATEKEKEIAMVNGHLRNTLHKCKNKPHSPSSCSKQSMHSKEQHPPLKDIEKPKCNTHKQRVRWNGFLEKVEPIGYNCCLCNADVAHQPSDSNQKAKIKEFADVAVLACGHVFHTRCLDKLVPKEQLSDPWCALCAR